MTIDPVGNIVLGGNIQGDESYGGYLAKLSAPTVTTGVKQVETAPQLLFPNPFRDFTYLKTGYPDQHKVLHLFNAIGSEVLQSAFDGTEIIIRRDGLVGGTYYYMVLADSGDLLVSGVLVAE